MFRIKLAAVFGGLALAFFGVQEYRVSSGTTAEPIDVDLAAVERGEIGSNSHWRLGEHVAVYGAAVYQYSQSKYDTGEPGPGAKVDYCFYPVISYDHPFIQGMAGEKEDENAPPQPLKNFRVLVKTKEFGMIGSIPDGINQRDSVQGLVINLISGLDSEEKDLFRDSFPQLDVDNLLLLEAGREPASLGKSLGMIGGGLALTVLGGLWFFKGGSEA